MKSSWISCVALELAFLLALAMSLPAAAANGTQFDPEELANFLLSPDYSQWLVGPIAQMASNKEIEEFLILRDDGEAVAFIEAFWERRGGESVFPTKSKKVLFDERAGEADKVFREGTSLGRRTDRGTIFVLYGKPEEIHYESPTRRGGEPIEVWSYPKGAEKGLDDRKPDRMYRFVKRGGKTVLYRGPVRRPIPDTGS